MKKRIFCRTRPRAWLLALLHYVIQLRLSQQITDDQLVLKTRVSASLFRGTVLTIIPHPIDTSTKIVRFKVSKYLKGCGDKTVNLYVQDEAIDFQKYTQLDLKGPLGNRKPEILVFACARDDDGIGWELSKGLDIPSSIKWNFEKFFAFENRLKDEFGCLDCCSSMGQCGGNLEEVDQIERRERELRQVNQGEVDRDRIGQLLGGFELRGNRRASSSFFGRN